jgi:hypothetical protein
MLVRGPMTISEMYSSNWAVAMRILSLASSKQNGASRRLLSRGAGRECRESGRRRMPEREPPLNPRRTRDRRLAGTRARGFCTSLKKGKL